MPQENNELGLPENIIVDWSNNATISSQATGGNESSSDWKQLKKDIEALQKQTESLKQEISDINDSNKDLENSVAENKKESKELKQKIIEGLGLFVAFITFVSTNVTVFSRIENISVAVFFMGLMLLCMLIFLYAFSLLMEYKNAKVKKGFLTLLGWTVGGVILSYMGMFVLEKNLLDVLHFIGKNKPICVNCRIDQDCNIQETYPVLQNK